MSLALVLQYLGLWTLIGAVAFSMFVIAVFRTGAVYNSRTEEGHLKEKMPLRGILTMLAFVMVIVVFMAGTNYVSIISKGFNVSFWPLFLLNLALILILIAYDTFVIDWIVIGFWRPAFLKLPAVMDKDEMREHIRRTFVVAPVIAVVLALLSAGVTTLIW